jgi:ribose transport system substrate-binding protein
MKKTLLLSLCFTFAVTIMVYGGGQSQGATKTMKIGYVATNLANQGMLLFREGAIAAAKEEGADLRIASFTDGDIATYSNAVEDLVDQGCAAIVAVYGGPDYDQPLINAIAAKVKVITIDSKSEIAGITSHVGINNYDAAAMGAEWMGKAINGEGTVVTINGILNRPTGRDRRNGFVEYLNKNYPNIKIFEVAADFNMEKALAGMEDALTALDNDVQGVYCAWDGGTISVLSVLEQAGLSGKVKLLGLDGAADALSEMKRGKIDADVAQPLFGMGYYGVKEAVKAIKGERVGPTYDLETRLVTISNVDEWVQQAHLSEFMNN